MGAELTLFALDGRESLRETRAWTVNGLTLQRDNRVFAQLSDVFDEVPTVITPRQIPPYMTCVMLTERGREESTTDRMGCPLTFVFAGELSRLQVNGTDNTAVMAWIRALPEDTPIILYW